MKRQPDGRFRGNRAPIELSNRTLIARWVEREVIRLKKMGVYSFETIAELLTKAGRGEYVPTVTLPDGVSFRADYRISKVACAKAYKHRMEREPSLEAREHRRLDTERLEDMYLAIQPGLKKGDTKSIEAAVRILSLKAKVVGYVGPKKIEVTGKEGGPVPITWEAINRLIAEADAEVK